jgi:L-amino acid N-acyltransferase YncA
MSYKIRLATAEDANPICNIYNYYVVNTCITFEEEPVLIETMQQRILDVLKDMIWLVYEENKQILGYAYYSKWKTRSAYRFCFESTIYLDKTCQQRGVGSLLYKELIERAKTNKVHSLLGGIVIPNEASIKLHEKLGFVKVGQLKEVGFKHDQWLDVGYWELIF